METTLSTIAAFPAHLGKVFHRRVGRRGTVIGFVAILLAIVQPETARGAITFDFDYSGAPHFDSTEKNALQEAANTLGAMFQNNTTMKFNVTSSNDSSDPSLANGVPHTGTHTNTPSALLVFAILRMQNNPLVPSSTAVGTIRINFATDWDFDDSIAADKYDFKSVIMHELLHAMGYGALVEADGSDPGVASGQQWSPFDLHLSDKDGNLVITNGVIDLTLWNSVSVGGASPAAGLFFNGANAKAANGGMPVGLYSPPTFRQGSSAKHLDTQNPALAASLTIHSARKGPGVRQLNAVERGIMTDIGYTLLPPICSYSFSKASGSSTTSGGSDSFDVTVSSACAWTPSTSDAWITITSAGTFGNGTVSYTVAANTGSGTRRGSILVGDQAFTVNQEGVCPVTLSHESATIVGSGVSEFFRYPVGVIAEASCAWSATADDNWITVSNGSGSGIGTFRLEIGSNPDPTPRTGSVSVNGQTFTVNQYAGGICTSSLSASSADFDGSGGEVVIDSVFAGCSESPVSNDPSWITWFYSSIRDGLPGLPSNFSVTVVVAGNPSASPRTGTLTMFGKTFTVNQAGGSGDTFTTAGNWLLTETSSSDGNPRPPYTVALSQTGALVTGTGVGPVACVTVSGADRIDNIDGKVSITVSGENCVPAGGIDVYEGQLSDRVIAGTFRRDSFVTGTFTLKRDICLSFSDGNGVLSENPVIQFPAEGGGGYFGANVLKEGCDATATNDDDWLAWFSQSGITVEGTIVTGYSYWIGENPSSSPRTAVMTFGHQTVTFVQAASTGLPAGHELIATTYQLFGDASGIDGQGIPGNPLAQAFVTGGTESTLRSIHVEIANINGSNPSSVVWELREDNNGNPAGSALEIIGTHSVSNRNSPIYRLAAAGTTRLAANTRYWLVMKTESGAVNWVRSFPDAIIDPLPSTSGTAPAERRGSADAGTTWTSLEPNFVFSFGVIGGPLASSPTITLGPVSTNVPPAGLSGVIAITATIGYGWTAATSDNWISITSGGSGSGNGTVGFTATANNAGSVRVGSIIVGGQTFTVIQAAEQVASSPSTIVNLLPSPVSSGVGISTSENLAQSFATDANGYTLASLSVLLLNNQAGASSVSVQLWTHANNRPGTMLESFAARSVSGGAPVTHTFPSDGGTTLTANTRYWVVSKVESGAILWGETSSAASNPGPGTVPDGRRVTFDDGATWSAVTGADKFYVIAALGRKATPGTGDTFTPSGSWTLTENSASGGRNPRPPYQLSLSETDGIVSGNGVGPVTCVAVTGADDVNGLDGSVIFVVSGANCTPAGTTDTYTGQLSGDTISGTYVSRDADPVTPDVTGTFDMLRNAPPSTPADYSTWANAFPGHDLSDPDADLNNNGQSNIEDWIWGIDPIAPTPARPLDIPPNTSGTFNYTRRAQSLSGYSFSVWYSTDLISWMEDTGATQTVNGQAVNQVETVQITPGSALMNTPGVFFQMRAGPNP